MKKHFLFNGFAKENRVEITVRPWETMKDRFNALQDGFVAYVNADTLAEAVQKVEQYGIKIYVKEDGTSGTWRKLRCLEKMGKLLPPAAD